MILSYIMILGRTITLTPEDTTRPKGLHQHGYLQPFESPLAHILLIRDNSRLAEPSLPPPPR